MELLLSSAIVHRSPPISLVATLDPGGGDRFTSVWAVLTTSGLIVEAVRRLRHSCSNYFTYI